MIRFSLFKPRLMEFDEGGASEATSDFSEENWPMDGRWSKQRRFMLAKSVFFGLLKIV